MAKRVRIWLETSDHRSGRPFVPLRLQKSKVSPPDRLSLLLQRRPRTSGGYPNKTPSIPQALRRLCGVYNPTNSEVVDVLIQQVRVNHSPPMVRLLEMRIGKQEEHLSKLSFLEMIGDVLHGIRPNHRDNLVLTGMSNPQRRNPFLDVFHYFIPYLHADHQRLREQGRETDQQSSESSSSVSKLYLFGTELWIMQRIVELIGAKRHREVRVA